MKLYDKLATILDEDVVVRRITYPRERLAKHLSRTTNYASLLKGKLAPEFTLSNLSGEMVSLQDVLGEKQLVLIEFWASWCAPCIAKIPTLKSLYTTYRDEGFEIVTISLDSSKEDWKQSSKELNVPWFDLGDMEAFSGSTAVAYAVGIVPANYLIDGNRRIVAKNVVLEEIEELLVATFGPDLREPTADSL